MAGNHGGARNGAGRKKTPPDQKVKKIRKTQAYLESELKLIESVAGGEVRAFIHDAAVDRAQLFAAAQEG